ncbi:MAG TPA: hypothetical protein VIZ58_09350 [Thermoanaerobaculia bacterium]
MSAPSPVRAAAPAPAARRALLFVAVWGLLVMGWATVARDALPLAHREGWPPEIASHAPPLARYDAGWYRRIALEGYGRSVPSPGTPSEHVFFPLYPALVAGVSRLLNADPFAAGMAVSLAALAISSILFVAEGARRGSETSAMHALAFLLLFPTAFFLASAYAESLFLLLALLAFDAVRRRAWAAAACFALLAGLTRLPALALAAPLAVAAASPDPDRPGLRPMRGLAVGAAPVAGVFLWIFGVGWYTREPGLYFRLQESWQRASSPLSGLARWAAALPERIAHGELSSHPAFLVDYLVALLFLLLGIYQARRRRWADASWTAGALLLPASTGISASLPRYLVVVYTAFYALAEIFRGRPVLRWLWWIASGTALLAAIAAFVNWRWVA